MAWGGKREGSGRKKANPNAKAPKRAEPIVRPAETKVPAVAAERWDTKVSAIDPRAWAMMLPEIEALSAKYAVNKARSQTPELNPFKLPQFPKASLPADEKLHMAMDNALVENLGFASNGWLAESAIGGLSGEGLLFLGYTYLSELAQRPEYRVMSETIADDATRRWIAFDVVGDEKKQREERDKDPIGYDERMADPDERKKRVGAAGKTDKVKALEDDHLRLKVKERFYEQCRNDGFFGRSHMFLDIRTSNSNEMNPEELKTPIGDGRDATSQAKVPVGSLKGLRTIEPVWTYPLSYNAINPLREDWYNPQVWFVQGQEIHGSRLQTFIGHPVPDMLKPAYAFGGLSLSQMSKPYVDRWLTTVTSVNQLIHSFSVMVLMTDLSTLMQPNNAAALLARVAVFNMLRDNQGAFVVNKNTEDFKNVSASLSGLHELQAQSQEHMASINRIPLVKYTGIQPAGLNASSEGEIEVYDDTIGAYQSRFADPNLRLLLNFEQLSLWGEVDPEITHHWVPLRPMTQEEKGKKEKEDMERNKGYVEMGAIGPGEVRKIIINDKELPYTGLDPDDVPEPPVQPGEEGGPGDDEPGTGLKGPERDEKPGPGKGGGASDAVLPFAAADNHWSRDPTTGEPVVLVGDAWSESEHPRGQPENAGQFGPGGGAGEPEAVGGKKARPRRTGYGGLYKATGQGAKADHAATVEYALKSAPRSGSSYRELLGRLIKDAPELGGDVEKLKGQLTQSYALARDQLIEKTKGADDAAEKVRLGQMAARADERAKALGWTVADVPKPAGEAAAWASDHDASPELRQFRSGTRDDLVRRGVAENLEDLSMFDLRTGKQMDMKATDRGAKNVQFTPEMVAAFSDPGNSIEMHHNHPSDLSFSIPDLMCLGHYPGMSRVYAHGHAGTTYVVDTAMKLPAATFASIAGQAGGMIYDDIGKLPLSSMDKSRIYSHAVSCGLDKAGIIGGYKAYLAPDLAKMIADRQEQFDGWVNVAADKAKRRLERK